MSHFFKTLTKISELTSFIADHQCNIRLALCHPAMTPIANQVLIAISQLDPKYILLELPLYRHSLQTILANIVDLNKDELQESTNSGNEQQPALLEDVNILLVEDNLVNQMVAKELLLSKSASVDVAENGQVALDKMAQYEYDLVLMDIQMPVMDGLTATKKIREQERFKQLPVIAMTAHARQEDRESSLAAGMNMHIAKPISAEKLYQSICQILSKPYYS